MRLSGSRATEEPRISASFRILGMVGDRKGPRRSFIPRANLRCLSQSEVTLVAAGSNFYSGSPMDGSPYWAYSEFLEELFTSAPGSRTEASL